MSVLMPVYNCEPYLDEAIRSIREQTFRDFEFVIVNDGSTDASLDIINRHATEDPRIVVLDRPNGGIVPALKAGLAACRGDLIARMDGDDIAFATRFERQLERMRTDDELVALGSWAEMYFEESGTQKILEYPLHHDEVDAQSFNTGICGMLHPTVVMRRAAIEQAGGYRDSLPHAEDLDLFLRLAEIGKLANLGMPLIRWRRHPNSICATRVAEQARCIEDAIRAAAQRRGISHRRHLAMFCYRASWTSADEGERSLAWKYAWRSFKDAPLGHWGVRSLARLVVRRSKNQPDPYPPPAASH